MFKNFPGHVTNSHSPLCVCLAEERKNQNFPSPFLNPMKPHLPLLVLLSLLIPAVKPDLAADQSALLAFRAAVGGRSLLWNISSPTPCSFTGVTCHSGRVTELHLPGVGLSGTLPENTLGNLTKLNIVSLRFNSLTGSPPADLAALTDLRNLYLQSNLFTGPIPDSVFSLPNLVQLNLASNQFSGPISPKFNSLARLRTLYLENNNLTGSIPVLDRSSLVHFNVSNNHLFGSIPVQLEGKPASSFAGNSGLCGKPLTPCNVTTPHHNKKLSGGAIAGIVIGSVLVFLLILGLLVFCCMRRGLKKSGSKEVAAVSQTKIEVLAEKKEDWTRAVASAPVVKKAETGFGGDRSLVFFGKKTTERGYNLEDLLRASAEVLGKGTFGTAYKAVLETGAVVAVKWLKEVTVAEKEFREKIEGMGRMEHENLVPLRAYYFSMDEKLLVYDYMPMGSLSALLHGNKGATRTPLNWETRLSIALGAARGIAYLHSQGPTVSHGNVKSSNVLLTKSYEARISDFGLSQLAGPTPNPNRIEGYRAPEVTDPRKVSQMADVYSFGVLILELLSGKAPTHACSDEEGVDLPRWVQSVVRDEWTNTVFDPELLRYQNVEEEMIQLLQLAIDCVAQYPDNRPSMSVVSRQIEDLCRSSTEKWHEPAEDIIKDAAESGSPKPSE